MSKIHHQEPSYLSRLLLVDDDEKNQRRFSHALNGKWEIFSARFSNAFSEIEKKSFSVIILGKIDEKAITLLKKIQSIHINCKILVLLDTNQKSAVLALNTGAFGVIPSSFNEDILLILLERARYVMALEHDLDILVKDKFREEKMWGENQKILNLLQQIDPIANSDCSVLISGESGTGKSLFAKEIHHHSSRKNKPFLIVNCDLLPDAILEKDLFGGEIDGVMHIGKIEQAQGGTIFFKEIGELSSNMQERLFNKLKEKNKKTEIMKEHGFIDIKIISSTRRNISENVLSKVFREDLFKCITGISLKIPSLRDRRDDILYLAKRFLFLFNDKMGRNIIGFTDEAIEAMFIHSWDGNVRELQNKIKSGVILSETNLITQNDLSLSGKEFNQHAVTLNLRKVREEAEKDLLMKVLENAEGNLSQSAHLLGISRPTLYILIEKYSLQR